MAAADQRTQITAFAQRLQSSGTAVFSTFIIGDVTCLRVAGVNHRSQAADADAALDLAKRLT